MLAARQYLDIVYRELEKSQLLQKKTEKSTKTKKYMIF